MSLCSQCNCVMSLPNSIKSNVCAECRLTKTSKEGIKN